MASSLTEENAELKGLASKFFSENHKIFSENSEQLESALSEMAAQLENAKIDHDDMKDLHESLTGHKWVDEKTVKICYKCERDFTIKRRKVNYTLLDQILRILDSPTTLNFRT